MSANEPVFFELKHKRIHITYTIDPEKLTYIDPVYPQYQHEFSQSDIHKERAAPGLLISAYLLKTIEQGYLSCTLVLPTVELDGEQFMKFETFAVLTRHRYGLQSILKGAREVYTLLHLKGIARGYEGIASNGHETM